MDATCRQFEAKLSAAERRAIARLTSAARIQALLDEIPYVGEERYRSPLTFLRERGGHCFDGALFAAMALRRLGHRGVLVDLLPNDRDDDHLIAIYRRGPHLGALAKSNYSGLRSREPVYRNVRELVMSYFEDHFNALGERTLRAYAHPLDLGPFDARGWMWDDRSLEEIGDALNDRRSVTLVTRLSLGHRFPDPRPSWLLRRPDPRSRAPLGHPVAAERHRKPGHRRNPIRGGLFSRREIRMHPMDL